MEKTKRIFVSYAWEDKSLVQSFLTLLASLAPNEFEFIIDTSALKPGDDITSAIKSMVDRSDGMIVFLPPANKHVWIGAEIALALSRANSDPSFKLIPIRIHNADVPHLLRSRLYLDFTDGSAEKAVPAVIEALRHDLSPENKMAWREALETQRDQLELLKKEYEEAKNKSSRTAIFAASIGGASALSVAAPLLLDLLKKQGDLTNYLVPIFFLGLGFLIGNWKPARSNESKKKVGSQGE